jgi:hypothetical protein
MNEGDNDISNPKNDSEQAIGHQEYSEGRRATTRREAVRGIGEIGIVTPPLTASCAHPSLGCSDLPFRFEPDSAAAHSSLGCLDFSFRFEPDSAADAHVTARESHDQSCSNHGFADPAGNSHKSRHGSIGKSPSVRMFRMPLEPSAMLSFPSILVKLRSQTVIPAPL